MAIEERAETARPWWEGRWFLALVVLATMVPLLYPPIPPLVDLLGHMGHYRVELDANHSPWLQRYYGFRWAPIGNLGVDLLIIPLGKLLGLELGVKLIVLAIPPLTAAAMLWVAREVHGQVPPTVLFALPFIYGFPFLMGFVNFALSMALAFLALGLWLRLGRQGQTVLRRWLFVPISLGLFFCHIYGWGVLGLMCFSAEAARLQDRGRSWWRAGLGAASQVAAMALPLLIVLIWRTATHGAKNIGWFDWEMKWRWTYATLRDRWGVFDMASLGYVTMFFVYAVLNPKLTLSRSLVFSLIALTALFVSLPNMVFGSAYADMRLVPYIFATCLLAIRLREGDDRRTGQLLAVLGLLFFAGRIIANTASLAIAANEQRAELAALDAIPRGARVASFYGLAHPEPWSLPRNSHLGALVIARREGFSNDQWMYAGHNLLVLKFGEAGTFAADPSEVVRPSGKDAVGYRTIDEALAEVPRDSFNYIWLIDVQPVDKGLVAGLQPVWRGRKSVLYRIRPDRSAD